MNRLTSLFTLSFYLLSITSCNNDKKEKYIYPNEPNITNSEGLALDSLKHFLLDSINFEQKKVSTGIHDYMQSMYSSCFFMLRNLYCITRI